jgi:beta-lactamase class A
VWPPGQAPLIVAVYLTGAGIDANGRNDVIAAVGRAIGSSFA